MAAAPAAPAAVQSFDPQPIKCDTCAEVVNRPWLPNHKEYECTHRSVECKRCGGTYEYIHAERHDCVVHMQLKVLRDEVSQLREALNKIIGSK